MKKTICTLLGGLLLAACAGEGVIYKPQAQIMPQHI